jgi:hypothetical protein
MYTHERCRCDPCRSAQREYQRDYDRRRRRTAASSDIQVDRNALADLLHELFPDGLTTLEERAQHEHGRPLHAHTA